MAAAASEDADLIGSSYPVYAPYYIIVLMNDDGPSQEFGVLENFRIRVLPVLGTMPAIFGQSAAAFVLCELAGKPFVPCAVDGLSRAVKHRMLQVRRIGAIGARLGIKGGRELPHCSSVQ